jgi:DNA polymerase-4
MFFSDGLTMRVILHCDLNNFYASVECLYNPAIRDKPVAVSGDIEQRHGIVLAKNYIAKKYGIQTGMALWQAKQLCRDIVFVPPNYDRYLKYSKMAKEIYCEYTDQVESFGLDECWLDITGSIKKFGSGEDVADKIRETIKFELGVTASIGVSFNKIFAKLGSDYKKPDATTVITEDNYKDIAWPLPAQDLLYVGPATKKKLNKLGILKIGDIARADPDFMRNLLGKNGYILWLFANGLDPSPVARISSEPVIKSIGNSTTTPRDLILDDDIRITMYVLCESVAARLREDHFVCSTVQITIRDNELFSYTRQGKLSLPSCNAEDIFEKAFYLYKTNHISKKPIRSLGVRACDLSEEKDVQLSFLPEIKRMQAQHNLESMIDTIRKRYGHHSIQRAIMLKDKELSDLDPKSDHIIHPISFFKN